VLTLKAAGLLDIDAGEIVRPGILRIEAGLIAGAGGPPQGEVIDLGELILLPGLMDMEVNLLMGGRGETAAYSPVQDDRRCGCCARSATPAARCEPASRPFGTWAFREDRGLPA
jgi:dihydroorotase-like cyclic amidohydrolase